MVCKYIPPSRYRRPSLEKLLQQLQESLLTQSRPVQVAFHIYEILSEAGYDDELISEVSGALTDIVA
jgi:hypothetical protein